jgi:uncharacterized membrane protein YkgB
MIERRITAFVERYGEWMLRLSFALVYIWFGALKPLGLSPAHELVESTLGWVALDPIVPIIGAWEVIIGACFLVPKITKFTLAMFLVHMVGTILPLVFLVEDTYTHWPYGLTLIGQYIVKNTVFLAAGGALWLLYRGQRIA